MKTLSRCIAALALAAGVAAQASPQDELKRFVDGVQSLSADFTQVQTDEKGKTLSSSSGRMSLARPGRFRWDYQKPYAQLMVCDGVKIWIYDPDLAQVTVRPAAEALHGTPAELLSQQALLSDAFAITDGGVQDGANVVRLTPKNADSDFKSIELWLNAGVPSRMKFSDQLGGMTQVAFSNVSTGAKVDAALFKFSPPKGVEVVEGQAR